MPIEGTIPRHVVVLVHGIRTEASWAEMVVDVLQQKEGLTAIPVRYGYFAVQRMALPFLRRPPVERLLREIRDLAETYPDAKISVIAHSFGAYAISRALFESGIRVRRLILCGSVIQRGYRWDQVGHRLQDRVVNECGTHDIWPVLAGATSFGLGPSGTFGFGTARVRDRFHKFSHSDYFDRAFVERFWAPYIWDGEIVGSDWEKIRPKPPWWQSVIARLPIKWLPLLALVLVAISLYRQFPGSEPTTTPPVLISSDTDQSDVVEDLQETSEPAGITTDLVVSTLPPPPITPAVESSASARPNLLRNPSFEDEVPEFGIPFGWRPIEWKQATDSVLSDSSEFVKDGQKSAYLKAGTSNHIRFGQTVEIQPNTWYLLTGWVRTRNLLHSSEGSDRGAHLAIVGITEGNASYPTYSEAVFEDSDWVLRKARLNSGGFDKLEVLIELGAYSGTTTGEAWFDNLVLIEGSRDPSP